MAHDHHHHDHSHSHHGHDHSHAPQRFGARFAIAAALNAAFIAAEIVYGFQARSLALLADAGHNFSDVIGLLIAWGAYVLARKSPGPRFTYGLRGLSILAAVANGLLLMAAVVAIGVEAVERLVSAQAPVQGMIVMAVAAAGIVVNGGTAWLFASGRSDLNIKAAFAHLAGDAVISAAVVVAGLVILLTGWAWLDPVLSLVVSAVILWATWGILKDAVRLSLQGVPAHIDYGRVKASLAALPGVTSVHDLHIWGMSTTEAALTAHLVMPGGHPGDAFLHEACHLMEHDHGIGHVTLQIETGNHACGLAPEEVV